jgi:hypothetical protein
MAMMKQDEARRRILAEWPSWSATESEPTRMNGLMFYAFLQSERPHLLEFRSSGDRWQYVHIWLKREGLVPG